MSVTFDHNQFPQHGSDIRKLIGTANKPLIFKRYLNDWPFLNWSLDDWSKMAGKEQLLFRRGVKYHTAKPQWENSCSQIEYVFENFVRFAKNVESNGHTSDYWLYYDYKHLVNCLPQLPHFSWKDFGFPERTKDDSTIWIGTKYAHTCCHYDSYSVNLIGQVYGRKQWILYPPETNLQATRVPYEESTVFSELNFFSPDETLLKHPAVRIITLEPGDVLFLPQRWWHYAECLSTSISVNTWMPINNDHINRLGESIVQYFVRNLVCDSVSPTLNFQKVANSVEDECWSLTRENCFNQIVESINICSNTENLDSNIEGENEKTTLPNNVNEVPVIGSLEEYRLFLRNKKKDENPELQLVIRDNDEFLSLKKIINACSDQKIIDQITENLLSKNH